VAKGNCRATSVDLDGVKYNLKEDEVYMYDPMSSAWLRVTHRNEVKQLSNWLGEPINLVGSKGNGSNKASRRRGFELAADIDVTDRKQNVKLSSSKGKSNKKGRGYLAELESYTQSKVPASKTSPEEKDRGDLVLFLQQQTGTRPSRGIRAAVSQREKFTNETLTLLLEVLRRDFDASTKTRLGTLALQLEEEFYNKPYIANSSAANLIALYRFLPDSQLASYIETRANFRNRIEDMLAEETVTLNASDISYDKVAYLSGYSILQGGKAHYDGVNTGLLILNQAFERTPRTAAELAARSRLGVYDARNFSVQYNPREGEIVLDWNSKDDPLIRLLNSIENAANLRNLTLEEKLESFVYTTKAAGALTDFETNLKQKDAEKLMSVCNKTLLQLLREVPKNFTDFSEGTPLAEHKDLVVDTILTIYEHLDINPYLVGEQRAEFEALDKFITSKTKLKEAWPYAPPDDLDYRRPKVHLDAAELLMPSEDLSIEEQTTVIEALLQETMPGYRKLFGMDQELDREDQHPQYWAYMFSGSKEATVAYNMLVELERRARNVEVPLSTESQLLLEKTREGTQDSMTDEITELLARNIPSYENQDATYKIAPVVLGFEKTKFKPLDEQEREEIKKLVEKEDYFYGLRVKQTAFAGESFRIEGQILTVDEDIYGKKEYSLRILRSGSELAQNAAIFKNCSIDYVKDLNKAEALIAQVVDETGKARFNLELEYVYKDKYGIYNGNTPQVRIVDVKGVKNDNRVPNWLLEALYLYLYRTNQNIANSSKET